MAEFKTGDVVKLKSGGFAMTVSKGGDEGNITCIWHSAKGEKHTSPYPANVLLLVEGEQFDITMKID